MQKLDKIDKNQTRNTVMFVEPPPEDNIADLLDGLGVETTQKAETDYIINDPEKFIKEYNDPMAYRNIDDFTVLALIESLFFAKTNELVLSKSEFITTDLFKNIMTLPSTATIKTLRLQSLQIKGRAFKYLSKCHYISLKELEIDSCPNVESQGIDQYFHSSESCLKNLQKIIFKKSNIEDSCVMSILNASQKMKEMREMVFIDCPKLTSTAFESLLNNNFENIRLLHFENIKMSDKVLTRLANCEPIKFLENLTLIKVVGITDQCLVDFFNSSNLVSLKFLEVRTLILVKGLFLANFQSKASDLVSLKIVDLPHLLQDQLESFLKNSPMPKLRVLEISQMNQILDNFMVTLTSLHFESLEELTLNNYIKMTSSSVVQLLASALTNTVKTLTIEYCTGLAEMPNNFSSLTKCDLKNLEKLSFNFCTTLSTYLLQQLGNIPSMSNLKILSLCGIPTVDDVACIALTKYNNFKNLKELYLDNCPNFSIRSFQEVVRNVMTINLEVFSLNGITQLNDDIWGYVLKSPGLKKLRDIRLKGLNITSSGVDKFMESDKMLNVEVMHFSDAYFSFPSIYQTEKCSKLKKIEGSWENVTPEDVENLLQSTSLSSEFQFQDLTDMIYMDDNLLTILTDSQFLKKIWEFPQSDIRDVYPSTIAKILLSPNLNPFFNIDRFLKEFKSIINDEILEAMSKSPLCINNLFDLDLVGSNDATAEGIQKILTSKYLCPLFNISSFIKSLQCYYGTQSHVIIPYVSKGNFTKVIKRLDLGDYDLESGILRKDLLLKPNVFRNLRSLNLSNTSILDEDLKALADNELMELLVILSLNNNPSITVEGFQYFFESISKKEIPLKTLMLEYCKITNGHLKQINEASFGRHLRYLALAGCKDIDSEGLPYLLDLINRYKKIDSRKILEDFKHYISLDDKKQFTIRKDFVIDKNEVFNFLKKNETGMTKKEKSESEKIRFMIRDGVMVDLCKDKKMENLHKLDLNNCAITSTVIIEISNCVFLKQLQKLYLENTNIDDGGIDSLCNSKMMTNLIVLDIAYCNLITKKSLENILNGNFHKDFNPDEILSDFAQKIDSNLLLLIFNKNKFFQNMGKLTLTQNNEFTLKDLDVLMKMQKENQWLEINVNLGQILDKQKSLLTDEILQTLGDSRIISIAKTLDLAGANISAEGLQAIFVSKHVNPNFYVQPLINSFSNLIDDDILNAISRGSFFRNIRFINLKNCSKISLLGLLNIARSPNPNFDIQSLLDDFGDKIDSLFIRNMVQQDYFEEIPNLILKNCKRLTTLDLLTIIKACHEDFDLESFILPENLPNSNSDLVTNEVIKAISQSQAFYKKFLDPENNPDDENRISFAFDIRLYRQIDYGINYLIENNVAPLEDYDDYLQNFSFFLSFKSICMINKIAEKGDNRYDVQTLKEQLNHVKKLDFSQNKQIYNTSFKSRLADAFESFQNQNNLNLENETIEYYVDSVLRVQDEFSLASDMDEEIKDMAIFLLIKYCKNLEEINLNNLNLGDYFLKRFSIYIAEEKKDLTQNLSLLRVFKIRNNGRFTSVGLKYLYCAAVKRTDMEILDVAYKGQVNSGVTYFVNNGFIGMVDYYIALGWAKLKMVYEKKRRRIIKFCFNPKTLKIVGLYLVNSAFILFHLLEKCLYYLPYFLLLLLKPLKLQKYLKRCLNCCFRCFDSGPRKVTRNKKNDNSLVDNSLVSSPMMTNSVQIVADSHIVDVKSRGCCSFLPCLTPNEKDEIDEILYDRLRQRFTYCMNALSEQVKDQSLFYFDESLVILNDILGQNTKTKKSQVISTAARDITEVHHHITKKFHLISKLRWIFLLNFFSFISVSVFYLIFLKLKWNQNASVYYQIPYFGYGVLTFFLELHLCNEVIQIINNHSLINITSPMLVASLFSSQAAKYDLFTDMTFVLKLYNYDPITRTATFNNIFIASLSVLALKLFIHLVEFLEFFFKYFLKRRQHQSYSSKNINSYSKTCFFFDFHGLGRLLDKFSTASAKKYRYWWLPKGLYNVYIPMVITATFTKLIIEDIPQLIIQTINIVTQDDINDFTILASLLSTIFTMFLTLHTAWNVRPSYFSRDLFRLYHENLLNQEEVEDDDSVNQSSSQIMDGSSYLEHSEHKSVGSYDDKSSHQDQKDEPQIDEKDEEREELFGGGRQKKIFFKEDI